MKRGSLGSDLKMATSSSACPREARVLGESQGFPSVLSHLMAGTTEKNVLDQQTQDPLLWETLGDNPATLAEGQPCQCFFFVFCFFWLPSDPQPKDMTMSPSTYPSELSCCPGVAR